MLSDSSIFLLKLQKLGSSDRNINALNKNEAWIVIKPRNHQIYIFLIPLPYFTIRQSTIKELMNIKRFINVGI